MTVTMTAAEYAKYKEFRGAEKTVASVRAQMAIAQKNWERLAAAVRAAADKRLDGTEIHIVGEQAEKVLALADEILS